MINVVSKSCITTGCISIAKYNIPSEIDALYCKKCSNPTKHKEISQKCLFTNCMNKERKYGFKASNGKKLFCKDHSKVAKNLSGFNGKLCTFGDCISRANFAIPGKKGALYCGCEGHGPKDKYDVNHKKCEACNKIQATYGLIGSAKRTHCASCQLPGMEELGKNKCKNCDTTATYGPPTDVKASYCKKHADEYMLKSGKIVIDLENPRCITDNCMKHPLYNKPGQTKRLYCKECALKIGGMVDVAHKKCISCKETLPSYNKKGETKALYCKECSKKETGKMIDVFSKICCMTGCDIKHPTYNIPTEKSGIYCAKHGKEKGMIDVSHRKCNEDGCSGRATYAPKDQTSPIYCAIHGKAKGLKNVVKKTCQDCDKYASFNVKGNKTPLYCSEHRNPDTMVNVSARQCCKCNSTSVHWGYPTDKVPKYCSKDALPGMINLRDKTCQTKECAELSTHGLLGKKTSHCKKCASSDMIDLIVEKQCCKCMSEYDVILEGKKYCLKDCPDKDYESVMKRRCKYCDMDDNTGYVCGECQKNSNKKEWAVVRHLKKEIQKDFVHDSSKMLGGCTKKRPDIYYELDKHCVLVEVDENQHSKYDDSCECSRLNQIVGGIGGKSVIVIRYNPDNIRHNNKKVNVSIENRLAKLVKVVNKELNKSYDTFVVKIIQLYYNDNYEKYQSVKEENITDIVCI